MKYAIYGAIGLFAIAFIFAISYAQQVNAMPAYIMNLLLSMMHDVSINNPLANQVLTYNGSYWINKDVNGSSGETTNCYNLGSNIAIIKNSTDGNCYVKYLVSGTNISITNGTDTITISATSSESTSCINVGSATLIIKNSTSGNCYVKSLTSGNGISLSNGTDTITISNSGVISNSCSLGISCSGTNPSAFTNTGVRSVNSGTGITVNATTGNTLITNSGIISNSCSAGITCSGTNPSSITVDTSVYPMTLLCQNTLSGSATSLSCSSFTAKKHLRVEIYAIAITNTYAIGLQYNSDTGTNYSDRYSVDGAADLTDVSVSAIRTIGTTIASTDRATIWCDIINVSAQYKTSSCEFVNDKNAAGGAGTAPSRAEFYGKWANTSSQITTITVMRISGTGSIASGSTIAVFGYD